jgi:hypothetical protein
VLLDDLARGLVVRPTLAAVPDAWCCAVRDAGFDVVYLLGARTLAHAPR